MKALEQCENIFGKLSPQIQKRIKNYIKNPTNENWDDIHGIIVNPKGEMITIWNAVININPIFPRVGRREDYEGNIIDEWQMIPNPLQVLQAIRDACKEL
jgi:hypothetical protein